MKFCRDVLLVGSKAFKALDCRLADQTPTYYYLAGVRVRELALKRVDLSLLDYKVDESLKVSDIIYLHFYLVQIPNSQPRFWLS
jgi:hypothetical protein